ncbi:MAG TPA: hypothetical protein VH914_14285 [Acidimicrobiia bacterium]|nr:hypothetical protein [Acidimicrobiia bacterium]
MRRRTAFLTGLAVGYYFGAQAGRERFEQIQTVLGDLKLDLVAEKSRALLELAVVRLQEAREERSAIVLQFPTASGE